MSGSMTLLQPESVNADTVKGLASSRGLGHHKGPYLCLRTALLLEPCWDERLTLPPGTKVMVMNWSVRWVRMLMGTCLGLWSFHSQSLCCCLWSMVPPKTTRCQGLGCNLWSFCCPGVIPPLGPHRSKWPMLEPLRLWRYFLNHCFLGHSEDREESFFCSGHLITLLNAWRDFFSQWLLWQI